MKQYLGICLIVLGAIVLAVSHFLEYVDDNWNLYIGLLLMIIGLIVHIIMVKRTTKLKK